MTPSRNPIAAAIRELHSHRELLFIITWREIRIRYKQSVMGFLWAILMPAIITGAGILVRFVMVRMSGDNVDGADVASIAVKSLPWAFFVTALKFGTNSLTANSNLVTKIKFPRMIFPVSAVLSALADLMVAAPIVLAVVLFTGNGASWTMLWAPVLLLVLVLFTIGLNLIASAANLFFRDVKYIVEVVLTFAIFFTPVLYEASIAGEYASLVMLNPIAPVLEGLRSAVVLGQQPDLAWVGYSALVSVGLCGVGIIGFRALEPRFAESI